MFTSYTLRRAVNLMGFRLLLSLYVGCEHKESSLRLLVDGRITERGTGPRFWEVDTPAKAETYFRSIDLDQIAESLWLDKRAAETESVS